MIRSLANKYKTMPVQIKASLWFLICSFLQRGISMITTPIFTRVLTTAEYGQFSVFNSWQSILTPIVCLNLFSGVYAQGVVKFDSDRARFSSSLQGLTFSLVLMWTIVYSLTSGFWNSLLEMSTFEMYSMLLLIWTSGAFSFWSMNEKVDFKYRKLVAFTIISSVIQPALSVFFIFNMENKVNARILGSVCVHLLYIGFFLVQMGKGKCFFSKRYWLYALKFNIPLIPHYLSMTILGSSDRIMISSMVGEAEAGIYSLAYSLGMIMTMFNSAMLQTIEPWIYRRLKEKRISDLARVAYPSFMLVAGLNIALIAFAPEIVRIFAPAEYYEAIWVIPSIALSVFFTFLYSFFATFEFYYEKTRFISIATLSGAVLNIVLNLFGIRLFGYVAAGYTTLISYILYAFAHYTCMRKVCKENLDDARPYDAKVIVLIGCVSIVVGFGLMATYTHPVIRYGTIALCLSLALIFRTRIMAFVRQLLSIRKAE